MATVILCDGPDCDNSISNDPDEEDGGWLHLDAWDDRDCGDFCSWECLAAAAMAHALDA